MTEFLIVGAIAWAIAAGIGIVVAVDGFLAECFGKIFQGSRLAATQKYLAVHVAHDGIRIILVDGKNIFLFGTAGFGGSEEYFSKILKKAERSLDRSNTVFGRYMCQGKMPLSVRQRYEGMKKQPIHLPNLDALIENFDNALSHPDADDLERLKQAVK